MNTVQDLLLKINQVKGISPRIRERAFFLAVIVLVAILSFGIGRLSVFYGGAGGIPVLSTDGGNSSE